MQANVAEKFPAETLSGNISLVYGYVCVHEEHANGYVSTDFHFD